MCETTKFDRLRFTLSSESDIAANFADDRSWSIFKIHLFHRHRIAIIESSYTRHVYEPQKFLLRLISGSQCYLLLISRSRERNWSSCFSDRWKGCLQQLFLFLEFDVATMTKIPFHVACDISMRVSQLWKQTPWLKCRHPNNRKLTSLNRKLSYVAIAISVRQYEWSSYSWEKNRLNNMRARRVVRRCLEDT